MKSLSLALLGMLLITSGCAALRTVSTDQTDKHPLPEAAGQVVTNTPTQITNSPPPFAPPRGDGD